MRRGGMILSGSYFGELLVVRRPRCEQVSGHDEDLSYLTEVRTKAILSF
jgi:hypothetical protein